MSALDYLTIDDLCELGGYENDPGLYAVLMMLFAVLQEGSLCLDLDKEKLSEKLQGFLNKEKAGEITTQFLNRLENRRYENLISENGNSYLPVVLERCKEKRRLYFQKFYVCKNSLRDRMNDFLSADLSLKVSDPDIESLIEAVYSEPLAIRVSENGDPIVPDMYQTDAIRLTLRHQFGIVSGGPGTGKTSLMVNILRCLLLAGIAAENILLAAPTGMAAQRMTEAVQKHIRTVREPSAQDKELSEKLKGSTLHKILRYLRYKNDFYFRKPNYLQASVIVADEVSMVDAVMMEKFLWAVNPEKTKLIFLGDKDQLPSVEAGAVFAEMIPDGSKARGFKNRIISLQTCYRSGLNLIGLAKQVNAGVCPEYAPGDFDTAMSLGENQWAFVKAGSLGAWKKYLQIWAQRHYTDFRDTEGHTFGELISSAGQTDADQLHSSDTGNSLLRGIFAHLERVRILSLVRNGSYGCIGINSLISEYLRKAYNQSAKADIFSGSVIMITRNDYSKSLFNGDVGVVICDAKGTYRAFFQRFGEYICFPTDILPPWETAFAVTVHKSQGSEFDDVLLVLPEDETHRLLSREIIYTGITRAKKRLILYGSQSAFETALSRKIERESGGMW
ncbi:MAG: exodeoxyribonuclease V subunit alpha [Desulfobacteraceae bacterium IS3]|nr:MAG: exodeoxyribonuclease V subunit alpha [Desulfobacteraceae bacterium IS3]